MSDRSVAYLPTKRKPTAAMMQTKAAKWRHETVSPRTAIMKIQNTII